MIDTNHMAYYLARSRSTAIVRDKKFQDTSCDQRYLEKY